MLRADECQTEEGQAGNHVAVHPGKETIQPVGMVARFADHHLIAGQNVDIVWPMQMLTEEHPEQHRPGQHRGEEALHRAIATTLAGPARDAKHGDPPGHCQNRRDDAAELAQASWLSRMVRCSVKVLQYQAWAFLVLELWFLSTTTLLQKPIYFTFDSPSFWRRYCLG